MSATRPEYKRLAERYNVQWTPTILVLDPQGEERHRIEGFLPADDFLSQLSLGLAKVAFQRGNHAEAERRFREIVDMLPFHRRGARGALLGGRVEQGQRRRERPRRDHAAFRDRYQDTTWAKKASVWGERASIRMPA